MPTPAVPYFSPDTSLPAAAACRLPCPGYRPGSGISPKDTPPYPLKLNGDPQRRDKRPALLPNILHAVTLFRSEYRADAASEYIVSAWDSRFVANLSGTYDLPRNWSVGARLSAVGGTPYTPYDVEKSSLVEAWNVQGRPYYDYTRYNDGRLDAFAQLDLRIDKTFSFRPCMLGL